MFKSLDSLGSVVGIFMYMTISKFKQVLRSRKGLDYNTGNYKAFNDADMERAISAVKDGMSKAKASRNFGVPRLQVAEWGYPLMPTDVKVVVQSYLDKQGRIEHRFKNNMPGDDFIQCFIHRNGLSLRTAGNIKRARTKVGSDEQVNEFFRNISGVIQDTGPENIFNYDETNVTDDPGSKKVLVPRGARRIERVQEHSKMAISIMVYASASGELLPPFVMHRTAMRTGQKTAPLEQNTM